MEITCCGLQLVGIDYYGQAALDLMAEYIDQEVNNENDVQKVRNYCNATMITGRDAFAIL